MTMMISASGSMPEVSPLSPPTLGSTDAGLRWSLLHYRLGEHLSPLRSAVWRDLRERRALNLGHGRWAVAHDQHGAHGLDPVLTRIGDAGGEHALREVGHQQNDDVELQVLLRQSCRRLWDAFFNGVDRLSTRLTFAEPDELEALTAMLDDLRGTYGDTVERDLLCGEAMARAGDALDRLADQFAERAELVGPSSGSAVRSPDGRQAGRRSVDRVATHATGDGAARVLVRVRPVPSLAWEQAFTDFESYAYRPSADRPPLRHGLFVWNGPSDGVEDAVGRLQDRIEVFGRSLD